MYNHGDFVYHQGGSVSFRRCCCAFVLVGFLSIESRAETTDERFRDLLLTASYSTAIGAALGAALLTFTDRPSENLAYIARGAAIGFLSGALIGSVLVFSPLFIEEPFYSDSTATDRLDLVLDPALVGRRLTLSPVISDWRVVEVATKVVLYRF